MSIELTLYLISFLTSLDNFISKLILFVICFIVFSVIGLFCMRDKQETDEYRIVKTGMKRFLKYMIILFAISITIPSEKTLYMMLAAHTGKKAYKSETYSKFIKVLDKKMDEYLTKDEIEKKISFIESSEDEKYTKYINDLHKKMDDKEKKDKSK